MGLASPGGRCGHRSRPQGPRSGRYPSVCGWRQRLGEPFACPGRRSARPGGRFGNRGEPSAPRRGWQTNRGEPPTRPDEPSASPGEPPAWNPEPSASSGEPPTSRGGLPAAAELCRMIRCRPPVPSGGRLASPREPSASGPASLRTSVEPSAGFRARQPRVVRGSVHGFEAVLSGGDRWQRRAPKQWTRNRDGRN
jgi:hypothetical protein